ncbi:hypothetical protein V9L05_20535 [Bernardetia sp. Wsw4-3y2]|uniref:hypothetical protein n=1 Tax=Bernardetia sp. Wsw4-3y2 TaxID=3127471 RepID=UPI0030D28ECF
MKYPYLEKQRQILNSKRDKLIEEKNNVPDNGMQEYKKSHELFLEDKFKESLEQYAIYKEKSKKSDLYFTRLTNGFWDKKINKLEFEITQLQNFFIWSDNYYRPSDSYIRRKLIEDSFKTE